MIWSDFTPRASQRARLLLAASIWTVVGTGILAAGCFWLSEAPWFWLETLPIALAAGSLKGRFVLKPRIDANARRIEASGSRDDVRCLFGAFRWGLWGVALLTASVSGWKRWSAFCARERALCQGE